MTAATIGRRALPSLASFQKFGRSLMLPIASLPVAALLLRLGQPDLLGADGLGWDKVSAVLGAAGGAIFDNLPLIFALGVAIGMAKKSDGSTALAAIVGYLVFDGVFQVVVPMVMTIDKANEGAVAKGYGVLGGIVIGLTAAFLWQRYYRVKLPPYLAFFGGRRFVPMVTAFAAIIIAVLMTLVYPAFSSGIGNLSDWIANNDVIGGFVYGTLNRLLIPLGLHHILNSGPWFLFGSYTTGGATYNGDITRFLNGDPTAGAFMTGFFPIMMFALPGAALAIWQEAKPAYKKAVGGIMIGAALTSFLTGVTEPLEFSFMFVAWPLYVIHSLLTGTSIALVNALGIKDGFGFSAGLFDFVLNWNIATKPGLLLVIGLIYGVVYYFLFRFVIRKWNLRTPGREKEGDDSAAAGFLTDTDPAAGPSTGTGTSGPTPSG
ncbi:PTS transporter subunit EIIC [Aeromicrobium sp.]|uniref:PTS transporter subunit EIIC n=1 Tax=Aeromicrobium sp. TaxID=1871063 RepID=UPI0019BCBC09|nr:PTS transporter subunit EIIC [Aeromicrobium sp.]